MRPSNKTAKTLVSSLPMTIQDTKMQGNFRKDSVEFSLFALLHRVNFTGGGLSSTFTLGFEYLRDIHTAMFPSSRMSSFPMKVVLARFDLRTPSLLNIVSPSRFQDIHACHER